MSNKKAMSLTNKNAPAKKTDKKSKLKNANAPAKSMPKAKKGGSAPYRMGGGNKGC